MKPIISMVSLAVTDLGRALAFYRDGLGFPTHNHADGDDFIMFRLDGSWLSLSTRAEALRSLPAGQATFSGVALSHNVPTQDAVREVFELGVAAGATVLKPPQAAPWGRLRGRVRRPGRLLLGHRLKPVHRSHVTPSEP